MAECIRLDVDRAAVCRLAASYTARDSRFAQLICMACAQVCSACAEEYSKHQHDHCRECAEACRRCARECRWMGSNQSRNIASAASLDSV